MDIYKDIVEKSIFNNFKQITIVDITLDSVSTLNVNNGKLELIKKESFIEFTNNCTNYIHEDDLNNFIEKFNIQLLENLKNQGCGVVFNKYRKLINGIYKNYCDILSLYEENNKKSIIVLTNEIVKISDDKELNVDNHLEAKLNKIVDAVSFAIFKIYNLTNNGNDINNKKDYINGILATLTKEFPELSKSVNDNMVYLVENKKPTILITDDDNITCNLLKKIFIKDYDVIIANNGKEAISLLEENKGVSCIFLDLIMPELDGFSVLAYLEDNNYFNKIPVIIISGNYDKATRDKAYSYGIADMLEKPFNVQVVKHRIDNLINLYRSNNLVNQMVLEQHRELKTVIDSIITSYEIDNNNNMKTIYEYARILALQVSVDYPEYNLTSSIIEKIAYSSMYYDIGRYTVPYTILNKKGMLSKEDRNLLEKIPINGSYIIKNVLSKINYKVDSKYASEIAKCANERYDGKGFPLALSMNQIPLSSHIVNICIEYNNLVNSIIPLDYDKINSLIEMDAGRKFDPKIVESFKKVASSFASVTGRR